MSAISYRARNGERRREHVTRQSNGGQNGSGIEFDVRVELASWLALVQHLKGATLGFKRQLKEGRIASGFSKPTQNFGTGIFSLVDAMAKAHQAVTAIEGVR